MSTPVPKLFLSRREAAEACSVSVDLIDAAVRAGRLRAKRNLGKDDKAGANRKVLFRPADLDAWVSSWEDA